MVQWCGLLVLVATAALAALPPAARSSPHGLQPALLRLPVPPAERHQDDAEVLIGLPAGVARHPTPPRSWFKSAPVRAPAQRQRVADDVPDPYRLPSTVVPTYYKLSLSVDLAAFTFAGSVDISLNVPADTNTIVLHAAKNLTFTDDAVKVEAVAPLQDAITVTKVERNEEYETVTVTLDKALQKDAHYTLRFTAFTSSLSSDLSGFYVSSYETSKGETRYLATTQFESTSARKAFPCFDEPSLKARFDIQIEHDKALVVRSNMPQLSQDPQNPGADDATVKTVFQTTVPMSTYLLAWVVSDFKVESNDDESFNTWAREDIVQGAGMSQEVGPKALEELHQYTGIPFELPKTDQFAIPDFSAGAMENWGLVTYREQYLIKTENTDVRYEQEIATVICHELSHQWTGNLVTLDWWSNTWLNEGFATFFENFICDKIKPEMKLIEKSVSTYALVAMVHDTAENQHAMSSPVSSPEEIEGKFDRISYSKGGTVLRMFQHVLTPAVFQKGLARYLANSKYSSGTPDKLFHAFNAEVNAAPAGTVSLPEGVTFDVVAKTWTEQAGVPVVSASCDFHAKSCTLTQKRLRPAGSTATSGKWYIPITLVTSKSADLSSVKTVAWLTPEKDSISVEIDVDDDADQKEWVVFNPQQTGYYRVNYDDASRKRILAALLDAKNAVVLDAATRAGLLSDVLGLADTEQLGQVEPVKFLQIVKDTDNSAVWLAAFNVVSSLVNQLANTDVYSSFKIILNQITEETFSNIGLKVKDTDDHNTRHLRYYVAPYACDSGNAACLTEAGELLGGLLDNNTLIHVDMAWTVMCYGLKASTDKAVFDQVKDLWQAVQGTTRDELASALTCSANKDLVTGLLTGLLSKAKPDWQDRNDLKTLLNSLITRPQEHHGLVLDFLKSNWQKMDTFFGESKSLSTILSSYINSIRSDAEFQEVKQWTSAEFAKRDEYSSIQGSLTTANSRLDRWFRKYYEGVAKYIYEETGTAPVTSKPTTGPTGKTTSGTSGPIVPTSAPSPPATTPAGASFVGASTVTVLALALFATLRA